MGGVFDLLEHWSLSSESRRALMDTPYTHCQAERRQSKQLKEGSVQLYICDLLQEGLFSTQTNLEFVQFFMILVIPSGERKLSEGHWLA